MKKFATILLASTLGLSVATTSLMADAAKGQKYYLKLFKNQLGMNGAKFAAQHTQAEWEEMFSNGEFEKVFGAKSDRLNKFFTGDKWESKLKPHIKDFCIEYAKDSGNVPSC